MKRLFFALTLALFTLLTIAPALAQDEFVFGVILVGPESDRGWSEAHYNAGLYVEENVPGAKMLFYPSLNSVDSPEVTLEDVVTQFVEQGAVMHHALAEVFRGGVAAGLVVVVATAARGKQRERRHEQSENAQQIALSEIQLRSSSIGE